MNAIFTPYSDLLESLNGLPPPKIQSKQLEKGSIIKRVRHKYLTGGSHIEKHNIMCNVHPRGFVP